MRFHRLLGHVHRAQHRGSAGAQEAHDERRRDDQN
jgi:hypothetical protein